MPRNQNALAHVNAAFLLKLGRKKVIESASIVIGNIDPEFINASKTEAFLVGKNIFNDANLQAAIQVLSKELKPIEIPGEPSPQSRKKLALGLFYKVSTVKGYYFSSRLCLGQFTYFHGGKHRYWKKYK